jgi:hypothetical protein
MGHDIMRVGSEVILRRKLQANQLLHPRALPESAGLTPARTLDRSAGSTGDAVPRTPWDLSLWAVSRSLKQEEKISHHR